MYSVISFLTFNLNIHGLYQVTVPTEEQKRLAQLSSFERIETMQDNIIKQMVGKKHVVCIKFSIHIKFN